MKKYLSRKFILSVLGAVSGIAAAVMGLGGKIGTVAGLVVTLTATVTYVITEGKIDAQSVTTTVNTAEKIATGVKDIVDTVEDKK